MYDTIISTFNSTVSQLQDNVYWLVLTYLLLSEFGTPIPLPGNFVLVAGGYLMGQNNALPLWLIAGSFLAVLPGATVLYWVGRKGGEPLLRRIGPRIGLTDARQQRVVAWLEQRAIIGLVIIRILPLLRVSTTLTPGAIGMAWPRYAIGMSIALLAWVSLYIGAGYGLALWGSAGLVALPLIALGGGGLLWYRQRSQRHLSKPVVSQKDH